MATMMEKEILKVVATADGSDTLFSTLFNQHYHSVFGAVGESTHIFLDLGFHSFINREKAKSLSGPLNILEVGLGTGLNCLLTIHAGSTTGVPIHYTALEPFPVGQEIWRILNYTSPDHPQGSNDLFSSIHTSHFQIKTPLTPIFQLLKIRSSLESFQALEQEYHIIYFDAFSPDVQPELWTPDIFLKLYRMMQPGGLLLTYCVKGNVVRAMRAAGLKVEKHPGPPGKRHVVRAIK
jgi:tRNA U34 5-methylaminomethyl-2-thiouridine-forming methyltransferase MnmC